jgi:CBS domain containing-hemolysin-like protein
VTSVEEIRLLAAIGHQEGDVGQRFASLIEGAASLRELKVHDVMVPRGAVAFLSGDRSLDENLETIRTSGHSRFPFSATGDLDGIEGVVLAKELLFHAHDSDDECAAVDWGRLITPLVVVPETKPLDEVLRLFQEQRKHLAIVVDEFGGTQGVVTLEDVLEEIVGEIEDEHDPIETLITKRKDGTLMCDALAETRKVFKELGIDKKSKMVSIGGLVGERLGRLPRKGDTVDFEGYRFRVAAASPRRAERIEIVSVPPPSAAGDAEPPASDPR